MQTGREILDQVNAKAPRLELIQGPVYCFGGRVCQVKSASIVLDDHDHSVRQSLDGNRYRERIPFSAMQHNIRHKFFQANLHGKHL